MLRKRFPALGSDGLPARVAISGNRRVGKAQRAHHREQSVRWWARRKSAFAHPTPAPDGQISVRTKNLSSPISKNNSLSLSGKSVLPARPVLSRQEGRIASRHERGMGCGGRGSVGAHGDRRASLTACERFTARKTNDAIRVRQNRVVPTPVAGAKLSVATSIQPDRSAIKPAATVTKRIRRRGEDGISRKTIAQGMPDCLR
jgi:hypothetical protein